VDCHTAAARTESQSHKLEDATLQSWKCIPANDF